MPGLTVFFVRRAQEHISLLLGVLVLHLVTWIEGLNHCASLLMKVDFSMKSMRPVNGWFKATKLHLLLEGESKKEITLQQR